MSFQRPVKHAPAAKVKFRVKGEKDGPVYQGQNVVIPCKTCGGKPRLDIARQSGIGSA